MWKFLAAPALALAVFASHPADAQQQNCAPRQLVEARLSGPIDAPSGTRPGYEEARRAVGLSGSGGSTATAIVEVWGNEETGTWTITVTTPNGLTCLVASGSNFQTLDEEITSPKGAPT